MKYQISHEGSYSDIADFDEFIQNIKNIQNENDGIYNVMSVKISFYDSCKKRECNTNRSKG